MSLDLNNQSMPYRIGRLFAVLEKARKDANKGDLSNYYTDAMKTPSTTFPKLIQQYIQKQVKSIKILFMILLIA